ncbi:hypothetical protein MVES1_002020 [Malassezia vespertilionis]|uniref:Glucose-methanol-choline oxidoreductase N-terminal domain-containing protein n=1 Tax=Malassezia vespertilionis TaxID=2020962 RepID=A0A2N1JC25_9BASI|nr:uncharacterized protein MVES1_002020 [Malassezia vespertilionis]PKI84082.1 hypothetical protein MVES_001911 [Malassezia vespertilionis]WFD06666.1 hypothetical protein MVES1_002020 [Malassezia vespertilionis]
MKLVTSGWVLFAVTVGLASNAVAHTHQFTEHVHERRAGSSITRNGNKLSNQNYDYVIIGGGTAGLALAGRLSDDNSVSVAVIEAGESGYDDNDKFVVPSANLYNSAVGTQYDWQYKTSKQNFLNGRRPSWPRGKVLGGSSAINGLYYVRHSSREQNIWADLAGSGGSDNWSWDNILNAMKKSEDFHGASAKVTNSAHIEWDDGSHGHNGPVGTTWPAVTHKPIGAFIEAAGNAGISQRKDAYGGKNWGTYVALSTIKHSDWTRSFSRTAYLDPISSRSNLHVLTGHTVTKINFDQSNSKSVRATSVNYSAGGNQQTHTVHANKEVILSAGTINDPQILQLSGIGDSGLLNQHNIDVVVNLPGVGQNLQDHLSAGMSFSPTERKLAGPAEITGDRKKDSYVNSAVSYVQFDNLFKDGNGVISKIQGEIDGIVNNANVPNQVKNGMRKTYDAIVNQIYPSHVAPVEILGNVMFGKINIQAALQHPLSRGSVKINSNNPFDAPTIDAGYLSQNQDLVSLRQAFKLIRKIAQQEPLKSMIAQEDSPGQNVQSNEQWEDWIRQNAGTEYHPSATCSMLPRSQGGVVGSDLKVHGTSNLRVVDASIPPISFSAHLMSITYGIAEIGAEIIKRDN